MGAERSCTASGSPNPAGARGSRGSEGRSSRRTSRAAGGRAKHLGGLSRPRQRRLRSNDRHTPPRRNDTPFFPALFDCPDRGNGETYTFPFASLWIAVFLCSSVGAIAEGGKRRAETSRYCLKLRTLNTIKKVKIAAKVAPRINENSPFILLNLPSIQYFCRNAIKTSRYFFFVSELIFVLFLSTFLGAGGHRPLIQSIVGGRVGTTEFLEKSRGRGAPPPMK